MSNDTRSAKAGGNRKAFVVPSVDKVKEIEAALLNAAKERKKVLGGAGSSRVSFLRGIVATLKKVKGDKLSDKEITDILQAQGVDISIATFRAFWKNENKTKNDKSLGIDEKKDGKKKADQKKDDEDKKGKTDDNTLEVDKTGIGSSMEDKKKVDEDKQGKLDDKVVINEVVATNAGSPQKAKTGPTPLVAKKRGEGARIAGDKK